MPTAAIGEGDRPSKPIGEIRKSFENIKASLIATKEAEDDTVIPPNLVRELRKSFENMPLPEPPSEQELRDSCNASVIDEPVPAPPLRTSSFQKATGSKVLFLFWPPHSWHSLNLSSLYQVSLDKTSPQSKSASSIPDLSRDEGYATFPNSPRKPGRPGNSCHQCQNHQ